MAEMEDRWLSMKEICKHLGACDDTVYKWINSHDMPPTAWGGCGSSRKMMSTNGSAPAVLLTNPTSRTPSNKERPWPSRFTTR